MIKNYKDTVEKIREIALSHLAVVQFGVGELSDIDVQTNNDTIVKYPLVFLIPQTSTLDRNGRMVLSFSMIVCDISKDQEGLEINGLNTTLGIGQDIISKFVLDLSTEIDIETPITFTPFIERFNNRLVGWTFDLNLIIQSPFDLCNAAF